MLVWRQVKWLCKAHQSLVSLPAVRNAGAGRVREKRVRLVHNYTEHRTTLWFCSSIYIIKKNTSHRVRLLVPHTCGISMTQHQPTYEIYMTQTRHISICIYYIKPTSTAIWPKLYMLICPPGAFEHENYVSVSSLSTTRTKIRMCLPYNWGHFDTDRQRIVLIWAVGALYERAQQL